MEYKKCCSIDRSTDPASPSNNSKQFAATQEPTQRVWTFLSSPISKFNWYIKLTKFLSFLMTVRDLPRIDNFCCEQFYEGFLMQN